MQRHIITIPPGFLRLLRVDWDIDWRGQSSGDRTDGSTQVVYNRFPRWVGRPEIFLQGAQVARWRAIRGAAQGRVGVYRIRMCDPVGFTDASLGDQIPYSNGLPHSTGAGFEYAPICTASLAAAAGATELRVAAGVAPNVGQIMSHDDWPFLVTSVETVSAGVYDLGVQMPLRAAIAAGDPINMQGTGLFEATDDTMGNPSYAAARVATVGLSFQEVLVR